VQIRQSRRVEATVDWAGWSAASRREVDRPVNTATFDAVVAAVHDA